MGKIEVYFKNLNIADDKSYYHEFIVWTPDKGQPQFIRGGPRDNGDFGFESGGGSGSSGSTVGKDGVNVPFGAILVKSGFYDHKHAQDWAKPGVDPSLVIKKGSDQQSLSYWQRMLSEKDAINKENIGYAAAGPNSNTVVTTLLQAVGLPLQKTMGWMALLRRWEQTCLYCGTITRLVMVTMSWGRMQVPGGCGTSSMVLAR